MFIYRRIAHFYPKHIFNETILETGMYGGNLTTIVRIKATDKGHIVAYHIHVFKVRNKNDLKVKVQISDKSKNQGISLLVI